MGAIVPGITGLTTALSAVDSLVGTVQGFGGRGQKSRNSVDNSAAILRQQQSLALGQLKARQAAQEKDSAQQALLSRQKIQAATDAAESKRLGALRRAVARQRAAFGASGIESSGGSSDAILLGLFDETDKDRTERDRLDGIRNRALDQGGTAQKDLNVLQVSQLRQRQQLQTAVDSA